MMPKIKRIRRKKRRRLPVQPAKWNSQGRVSLAVTITNIRITRKVPSR